MALRVAEDLHLDVPRPLDEKLGVKAAVAEIALALAAGDGDGVGQRVFDVARSACPCRRRPPPP